MWSHLGAGPWFFHTKPWHQARGWVGGLQFSPVPASHHQPLQSALLTQARGQTDNKQVGLSLLRFPGTWSHRISRPWVEALLLSTSLSCTLTCALLTSVGHIFICHPPFAFCVL